MDFKAQPKSFAAWFDYKFFKEHDGTHEVAEVQVPILALVETVVSQTLGCVSACWSWDEICAACTIDHSFTTFYTKNCQKFSYSRDVT